MKFIRLLICQLLFFVFVNEPALFAVPIVTSLSPNFGPVAGGTNVTITGSGFTGATSVEFGSRTASIISLSDTSITATSPESALSTVTVSVTTPSGTSAAGSGSYFAYQGSWTAYVANLLDNNVTRINLSTNTAEATIFGTFNAPFGIAITPDGSAAYVINQDGDNATVINLANHTIELVIDLAGSLLPRNIAITPDGTLAYVACQNSNNVIPINLTTNTSGGPINIGIPCFGIAITPDSSFAYTSNISGNQVTPISLPSNTTQSSIFVGDGPQNISITPDGTTAYVVNTSSDTVTPINVSNQTPSVAIPVGNEPNCIAITPDGTKAYTTNTSANTIFQIITATNTSSIFSDLGITSYGIGITPDGLTAYVTNADDGLVTPINLVTGIPGSPIPTGSLPQNIAITPDPAPIAVFQATLARASSATTFDASNSVSSVGSIANYQWDFGDGNITSTSSPIIMHTYVKEGSYSVTLTVTNTAGTSTTQVFTGQTMSRNGGASATTTQTLSILPPSPIITSISPKNGPTAGGTFVTITGSDFSGATAVYFGATPAASFIVNSNTSITAISPPQRSGVVDITVTTPGGTSFISFSDQFRYLIQPIIIALFPNKGPITGRTSVTIIGVNFSEATAVEFGNTPAIDFVVNSDSSITAISPPQEAGIISVAVTTPGGTSTSSISNQFRYTLPIFPPNCVCGCQFIHRCTRKGYTNLIEWNSPTQGIAPVTYKIFRNASLTQLIAIVPAADKKNCYKDHNRKKNGKDTYYIISVGANGEESLPRKITIRDNRGCRNF